ncbi:MULTISPECIES: prephenate dehydrogenase dimerization domain-containing protein [unclassified Photobacterium]|uniref:prephenate dehydrogenase dimerization domain-containing protein n=2 Tax=Photobacterium TaxID=657 RepID=UPI001EDA5C3A|nr:MULTISPECIES: prephenate dehydrogenase dimerization domain-containing protein [unclassified Photobacterium]MCG2843112.1 prephenate dehydrogenase/arogenate dehydrogenase family protein [Photobacterium sp. WH80]
MSQYVIFGGAGVVGQFMATLLESEGYSVTVADQVAPAYKVDHVICDVRHLDPVLTEKIKAASGVVFALPESVAAASLAVYAPLLTSVDVVVNTCSVQVPFHQIAADCLPSVSVVGVNPMFSPKLACHGRPVIVCEQVQSQAGAMMSALLARQGMDVSQMNPSDHDNNMALCQALPHAAILSFLTALVDEGCDIKVIYQIAPPPMKTLLSLAARILANEPETYWDIQAYNQAASKQRDKLMASLSILNTQVESNDFSAFVSQLDDSKQHLKEILPQSEKEAECIFQTLMTLNTGGQDELSR